MKLKRILSISLTMMFLLISLIGCAQGVSNTDKKPTIAVSIVPQETFVKAVAGDTVDIITMIPPGNSPANYQPKPQQMQKLSDASIYFSIGVPTEVANIMPKVEDFNKDIKIIELENKVAQVYPDRYFEEDENHNHDHDNDIHNDEHHEDEHHEDEHHEDDDHGHVHEGRDPHIWLSPKRVKVK